MEIGFYKEKKRRWNAKTRLRNMDFNPGHDTNNHSKHIDGGGLGQRIMDITFVQRTQDMFVHIREDERSNSVLSELNELHNQFYQLLMNTKFGRTGFLNDSNRIILSSCGKTILSIKRICPWYDTSGDSVK